MTDRFVSSGLTKKNIRFKVQIGDYSKYVCKGYYTSPEFGNEDCKWNLLVHVYDGADHENFIDVRLQRRDFVTEQQFIEVKTSIVSGLGLKVLKTERKMMFADGARILAVAKADLKGYYGLKKWFYLPNDTLTLQCDLVVHERSISTNVNFFGNISHNMRNPSDFFTHSRLVKTADDYFRRRIQDFSLHAYGGRIETPEYQSEHLGGKWSLVVCSTAEDNVAEYLDIRVMRQESYEHQLVKVRLSITDRSDKTLLTKEKYIYFTSSREVQILTLNEKSTSGWFGIIKKDLIPDDTLTLHCEMILYEQVDDNFTRKKAFNTSIEKYGYAPTQLLPYFAFILFTLPVAMHILYSLCLIMLTFIWYTILYLAIYIIAVIALAFFFTCVKIKAEDIKEKELLREIKKKIREERKKLMLEEAHKNGIVKSVKNQFLRKQNYSNHMRNDFSRSRNRNYSYQNY